MINGNYTTEYINNFLNKEEDFVVVSNNLNLNNGNGLGKSILETKDIAVDTQDLINDNAFDFENLKNNYMNNMISWNFLKKVSEFNQWPLGCIGNFLENSMKSDVCSNNIYIDVKCYDKRVYIKNATSCDPNDDVNSVFNCKDFTDKILVLSIIDDGKGMSIKDFNQVIYSFSVNEKKEYNFFQYGMSMKSSAIRLANSFFIVSKTESELSIGLISRNLQIKMNTDLILTPIVNYTHSNDKYTAKSNFASQSLNLILNEIKFLFNNSSELFAYLNNFTNGTHIFLYDLRQNNSIKSELNQLKNYELLLDLEEKDILFNYFNIQIGEKSLIDCSLKRYLKYFNLKPKQVNTFLLGSKIDTTNPLHGIHSKARVTHEALRVNSNLKTNECKKTDCIFIEGGIYKGVLINENFLKLLNDSYNFNIEYEKEYFNGVLLYRDNRLICRLDQNKLGDICFFIKKYEKIKGNSNEEINFFPVSGFVELPRSCYELLYSKTVI